MVPPALNNGIDPKSVMGMATLAQFSTTVFPLLELSPEEQASRPDLATYKYIVIVSGVSKDEFAQLPPFVQNSITIGAIRQYEAEQDLIKRRGQ